MGLPYKYQVVRPLKSNQLLDEYNKGPDGPFALVAQRKQVVTNDRVNEQNQQRRRNAMSKNEFKR